MKQHKNPPTRPPADTEMNTINTERQFQAYLQAGLPDLQYQNLDYRSDKITNTSIQQITSPSRQSDVRINNWHLGNVELTHITLHQFHINHLILEAFTPHGITIRNSKLESSELNFNGPGYFSFLEELNITGSKFDNSNNLGHIEIRTLEKAEVQNSTFINLVFKNSTELESYFPKISASNFTNCHFSGCIFIENIIQNCTFKNCTFENCHFLNNSFINSNLQTSTLKNSLFISCHIDTASKMPADFEDKMWTLKKAPPSIPAPTTEISTLPAIVSAPQTSISTPLPTIEEEIVNEALEERNKALKQVENAKEILCFMLGLEYNKKLSADEVLKKFIEALSSLHFSIHQTTGDRIPPTLAEIKRIFDGFNLYTQKDRKKEQDLAAANQEMDENIIQLLANHELLKGELTRIIETLTDLDETKPENLNESITSYNLRTAKKIHESLKSFITTLIATYKKLATSIALTSSFSSDLGALKLSDLIKNIQSEITDYADQLSQESDQDLINNQITEILNRLRDTVPKQNYDKNDEAYKKRLEKYTNNAINELLNLFKTLLFKIRKEK